MLTVIPLLSFLLFCVAVGAGVAVGDRIEVCGVAEDPLPTGMPLDDLSALFRGCVQQARGWVPRLVGVGPIAYSPRSADSSLAAHGIRQIQMVRLDPRGDEEPS